MTGADLRDGTVSWLRKCVPLSVKRCVRFILDHGFKPGAIGLVGACDYLVVRRRAGRAPSRRGFWRVRLRGWPGGVWGRYGSSDLAVFRQMFIEREHDWARAIEPLRDGALILDCGANVGLATVCLLRMFPGAFVIAVEPDADNLAVLERNVRPRRDQVEVVRAGVWSRPTHLVCHDPGTFEHAQWALRVCECAADTPGAVQAVTVGELLRRSGRERIAILKMDIEGAEAEVFGTGPTEWLDRTDAIAIELHDGTAFGPATAAFQRAIREQDYRLGSSGELTTAIRPTVARRTDQASAPRERPR